MGRSDNQKNGGGRPEAWLEENRSLRMDANHPGFPQARREFHIERYRFASPYCVKQRVLDAACGTGYGSNLLAQNALHVTGIDFSEETVNYAQSTYDAPNIEFLQSFVELTPFADNHFDRSVSFETIEHTLCPKSLLREFTRVLKTDGLVIVSAPILWGFTKHHFFDFDWQQFDQIIKQWFQEAEYYYQNSGTRKGRTPKGIGHINDISPDQAECVIAVLKKPLKLPDYGGRTRFILQESYENAFARHHDYLKLAKRDRKRLLNRVRTLSQKAEIFLRRIGG